MDLHGIWTFIRFHWIPLLLAAVIGGGIGLALASAAEREYTAESELFIAVANGRDTGGIAQGADYSQQQARNFSAVATREIVLEPVIERLGLDLTVGQLRRKLSTSVPLNTSIISISATDPSPAKAAQIANATAQSLVSSAGRLTPKPAQGDALVTLQSVETATTPSVPSSPNPKLFIILGMLGGMVVAVAAVTVRDLSKAKVRTAEQARNIVGASIVGSIMANRSVPKSPMAIASAPSSLRAEEFRQLRTNVRFLQTDRTHKAFVITSSVPGEGKSTTSANLAAAIAASGTRVCLVEADLRRPSLGSMLDLDDGIGLTTLLAGEAKIEDVLQPWGDDGLVVLLAGEIPPNPSELLGTSRAETILRDIVNQFDVTIIDSPPLNPVTDASILARLFGGAILVVGSKKVEMRELRRAVERMSLVEAEVLGTVLCMAPTSVMSRYRHSYSARGPLSDAASTTTSVVADDSPASPPVDAVHPSDGDETSTTEVDDTSVHDLDANTTSTSAGPRSTKQTGASRPSS
ncbi:polysaccharide biosynthesis tyrosine autokinase [Aeromicrobium sp.]|uniref:polysaccharide biosynthesis tyrosine autokinase n=1 Tax=Aeromicrobium sp. TaxID=1871063 RepID=UPI00198C5DE3|nr:polysaccharide biosynthesis tyrosine autokinase [Aeromicrobium sp.]MBC7632272.1 polysaccharide biosynthesis tyrosine autokinase [Aeromicrobium sp.]